MKFHTIVTPRHSPLPTSLNGLQSSSKRLFLPRSSMTFYWPNPMVNSRPSGTCSSLMDFLCLASRASHSWFFSSLSDCSFSIFFVGSPSFLQTLDAGDLVFFSFPSMLFPEISSLLKALELIHLHTDGSQMLISKLDFRPQIPGHILQLPNWHLHLDTKWMSPTMNVKTELTHDLPSLPDLVS